MKYNLVSNEYYELEKCKESEKKSEEETVIEPPDSYKGKPVAAIADYAFANNHKVRKVVIPDSVTSIGTIQADGWIFNLLPPAARSETGTDADCLIISTARDEDRNENMLFNGVDVGTAVYLYYKTGELYRIYYHRSSPNVGDKAGRTGDTMTSEQIWEEIRYLFGASGGQ